MDMVEQSVQMHWSWASNPVHRPHPRYPIWLGQPAGGSKSQTVLTVRAGSRRHVAHSCSFPLKCTKPIPTSWAALQRLRANLVLHLPLELGRTVLYILCLLFLLPSVALFFYGFLI